MSVILNPLTGQLEYIPESTSSITPIQTITANTTLSSTPNQIYEIENLTADITITLPALTSGWYSRIIANNSTSDTVTITTPSGNIFFGSTTGTSNVILSTTITGIYEIFCDGSNYYMFYTSESSVSSSISVTGTDITMSGNTGTAITNATLATTGVTAGTYGSATTVPELTIDAKGRITSATTVPISGGSGGNSVRTVTSVSGNITITASDIGQIFELQNVTTYPIITLPAVSNGFYVYLYLNTSNDQGYYYEISPPSGVNIYWNGISNASINIVNSTQNQGMYYIFCDGTNYFLTYQPNYYNAPINNAVFTGSLNSAYNTLDDGDGNVNIYKNLTIRDGNLILNNYSSYSGTTSGTINYTQYLQGAFKAFAAQFINYENDSTTVQTITFTNPFTNTPIITTNTTGLTITASTTTLTISAPDNTTLYNGIVKVEGF